MPAIVRMLIATPFIVASIFMLYIFGSGVRYRWTIEPHLYPTWLIIIGDIIVAGIILTVSLLIANHIWNTELSRNCFW